jgi:hypothetical protein
VIARVATFDAGRELAEGRSAWVLEALDGAPGLRCAYHLAGRDGTTLSISVWDSPDAARAGAGLVGAAREAQGLEPDPPDKEDFYEVVGEYRAPTA